MVKTWVKCPYPGIIIHLLIAIYTPIIRIPIVRLMTRQNIPYFEHDTYINLNINHFMDLFHGCFFQSVHVSRYLSSGFPMVFQHHQILGGLRYTGDLPWQCHGQEKHGKNGVSCHLSQKMGILTIKLYKSLSGWWFFALPL